MSEPINTNPKLTISKRAMWGYKVEDMNPENPIDAVTIISRAFDAGTHDDMLNVINYYGIDRIKQALTTTPDLQASTINLTAIWLDIQPSDFYAFKKRASEPIKFHAF